MDQPIEHHQVKVNGVELHVAAAGPESGPLVILLHGFPEYWAAWTPHLRRLAAAGARVLAPDQRGYNLSAKPEGSKSYALDALGDDVLGLADWAGRRSFRLAGHDWGAAVAWWLGATAPERVERLAVVNVPHPLAMQRRLRSDPAQMLRSWYMAAFQIPLLPEWICALGNYAVLRNALRNSSRPGTFSDEDLAEYVRAWSRPGALRGGINWYRAALRYPPAAPRSVRVKPPTLLIWGAGDRFLVPALAADSMAFCENGVLEKIDDATHWVAHEERERVGALLERHLLG